MLNFLFLAHIFWVETNAMGVLMIAHRHAIATAPTDDQSLQQSRSFSRGTVAAISAVGLTIGPQLL